MQIYQKSQDLGVEKKHKAALILVQALFTAEIDTYKAFLAKMVTSEKHQKVLLGDIERFVELTRPELVPSVPNILIVLYQIDLLEEDVVIQWGLHAHKKYVDRRRIRKSGEPFLKWLERDGW